MIGAKKIVKIGGAPRRGLSRNHHSDPQKSNLKYGSYTHGSQGGEPILTPEEALHSYIGLVSPPAGPFWSSNRSGPLAIPVISHCVHSSRPPLVGSKVPPTLHGQMMACLVRGYVLPWGTESSALQRRPNPPCPHCIRCWSLCVSGVFRRVPQTSVPSGQVGYPYWVEVLMT